MSKRVLVDTGILISYYNQGVFEERLLSVNQTADLLFSAVSINEFIRGAHSETSQEIVTGFLSIVKDRIMTPTEENWLECGFISEKLLKGKKRTKEGVVLLQNDVLIGLCSRDAGATLITSDHSDFRLLQDLIDLDVDFW